MTLREIVLKELEEAKIVLNHQLERAPRISTGLPALDYITGGTPLGRLMILWGPEQTGKSTTALYMAKEMIASQKRAVVWIDVERAFSEEYAASLGVDLDGIILHRPRVEEPAEETLEKVVEIAKCKRNGSGLVGMIIIDSMNSLSARRSLEGGLNDKDMGSSAKMFTNFAKQFPGPIDENNIALIMIAQMRQKLGVMYGSPDTLSGGMAIKHASRLTIKFRTAAEKTLKDGTVVATIVKPIVVKSSVYGAKHKATAEMELRRGAVTYFDPIPQLLWVGAEIGVFTNADGGPAGKGTWYYKGEKIAVGKEKVADAIRSDPLLLESLSASVYDAIQRRIEDGTHTVAETVPDAVDDFAQEE